MQHWICAWAAKLSQGGTFNNNVVTMTAGLIGARDVYTPEMCSRLNAQGDALRVGSTNWEKSWRGLSGDRHRRRARHALARGAHHRSGSGSAGHSPQRRLFHLELMERGYYIAQRGMINLSLPMQNSDIAGIPARGARVFDEARGHPFIVGCAIRPGRFKATEGECSRCNCEQESQGGGTRPLDELGRRQRIRHLARRIDRAHRSFHLAAGQRRLSARRTGRLEVRFRGGAPAIRGDGRCLPAGGSGGALPGPEPTLPYQIFARDSSVMTPWGAVIMQLQKPYRRGEYAACLKFYLDAGIPIYDLITAGNVEGGDFMVLKPGVAACGYSGERSIEPAVRQMQALVRSGRLGVSYLRFRFAFSASGRADGHACRGLGRGVRGSGGA